MSLRVSASPCENGVVLVFVSGHSAQSQQEQGFTRRHEGTELGF
jgi:hypothetical protein